MIHFLEGAVDFMETTIWLGACPNVGMVTDSAKAAFGAPRRRINLFLCIFGCQEIQKSINLIDNNYQLAQLLISCSQ